eukprot:7907301-Pyramimonas_sp.AAC.1
MGGSTTSANSARPSRGGPAIAPKAVRRMCGASGMCSGHEAKSSWELAISGQIYEAEDDDVAVKELVERVRGRGPW